MPMGARSRLAMVVVLAAAPTACNALFSLDGLNGAGAGGDAAGAEAAGGEAGHASGEAGPDTGGGPGETGAEGGGTPEAGGNGDADATSSSGDPDAHDSGGTTGVDAPPETTVADSPHEAAPESGTVGYAQTVLADGPIGYWRLDEPLGATVAKDSSGHGNDGTYVGGVALQAKGAIAGDSDTAATFDGATGWVDVGAAFPFTGTVACSFEVWAMTTADDDYRSMLSRDDNATGPSVGYLMYIEPSSNPYYNFERVTAGQKSIAEGTVTQVVPNTWQHVVATFDGTKVVLYVNGVVGDTESNTFSVQASTHDFVIGAEEGGQTAWWEGPLDEVAVYDYALTQTQVQHHYAVGTGHP